MSLDFTSPLSGFTRQKNAASFAIAQEELDIEAAIAYLVDLYEDDVDIEDPEVFKSVLQRYGVSTYANYITQEVGKRL